MNEQPFLSYTIETERHRTVYLESGPPDGPLMIFIHGWPELGMVWHLQLKHFSSAGWRCIAPDMRGYGKSSVPEKISDYQLREIVHDMTELHDLLGAKPAVWIGHDWGSPVVWAMASHHAQRCLAVINLCVPYFSRGFVLSSLLPLVDRNLYPAEKYPAGQWDYFLFYRENFRQASQDFEADIASTIALLYRTGAPEAVGSPAITASIREKGGWFGLQHRAPQMPVDTAMLSHADYDTIVSAFKQTGFNGADSWYMNDEPNSAYAAEAPNFGRLELPVLFLHANWDATCDTVHSPLAVPMRQDCFDLTELTIEGGHELQLEKPTEVNAAIDGWLYSKGLSQNKNNITN